MDDGGQHTPLTCAGRKGSVPRVTFWGQEATRKSPGVAVGVSVPIVKARAVYEGGQHCGWKLSQPSQGAKK